MATGFVGLGAMGKPMALSLHRAGLLDAVWNRSDLRAEQFAAETGCGHCSELAELAATCGQIILCVSADADVLEVVDGLVPHLRSGSLVIDCSTVNSATAREAAERLAGNDVDFLDCPVSGGTEGALAGTLSIMVGGEPSALERARPVLEAMGKTISHLGGVGAGQAAKAANQIMVAGINQAVTEALAFGHANGLPMDRLITALEGGAAACWFLSHRGPNMAQGVYPLGFKVELHDKDLQICRQMAETLGARLPVVEMTLVQYRRLMDAGSAEEDISSLYRLKSALFSGAGQG